MKPPIVSNESPNPQVSGDLSVYDSVEWAQKAHEPYVADDPMFRLYDSEGRLLKMRADWDGYRSVIEPAEEAPTHLEQLTSVVKDFLVRTSAPAELLDRPLGEMIAYIYERDPNPSSGYRPPGKARGGAWQAVLRLFRRR